MEAFTPAFLVQIVVMTAATGTVYGAIRSDLKAQRRDIDRNSRAIVKAHERIDRVLIRE